MTRPLLFLAALALAVPVGGYQGAEHRPGQTLPPAPAPDLSAIPETWRDMIVDAAACANGNTHYALSDDTRDKLNLYGPEGAVIGENIKIKIITDEWRK